MFSAWLYLVNRPENWIQLLTLLSNVPDPSFSHMVFIAALLEASNVWFQF